MSVPDTNDASEPTHRSTVELAVPSGYTRIRFFLHIGFALYLVGLIVALVTVVREDTGSAKSLLALPATLLFCLLIYAWNRVERWSLIATVILGGVIPIGFFGVMLLRVIGARVVAGRNLPVLGELVIGLVLWLVFIGAYLLQPSLYRFFWRIRGLCPLCKEERFKGRIAINRTWECPRCIGSVKWVREVE